MTRLSVNINKVALIRNGRGGNLPDLVKVAQDCETFGAQGITVHPRPDERHIRYSDVPALKAVVKTELNVEGNPTMDFMELVLKNRPHQCTLVPDSPDALTSDQGWDTVGQKAFLTDIISTLKKEGIRVLVFVDPVEQLVEGAKVIGADCIEFYTGHFARLFPDNPGFAIEPHVRCARLANEIGLEINAGHDLNLDNLRYYKTHIEGLKEVSIGHALISDALYFGLQNTIRMYLNCLI